METARTQAFHPKPQQTAAGRSQLTPRRNSNALRASARRSHVEGAAQITCSLVKTLAVPGTVGSLSGDEKLAPPG